MKKWWKSKTIQFGLITVLGSVLTGIANGASKETIALGVVGALNILLRKITSAPIE